jgi:hypothetical protein
VCPGFHGVRISWILVLLEYWRTRCDDGVTRHLRGVTVSSSWTGRGAEGEAANLVAVGATLAAGQTHTYTVAVVAEVDADMADTTTVTCPASGSDEAGGFANTAGIAHNDLSDAADACAAPEPPPAGADSSAVDTPPADDGRDERVVRHRGRAAAAGRATRDRRAPSHHQLTAVSQEACRQQLWAGPPAVAGAPRLEHRFRSLRLPPLLIPQRVGAVRVNRSIGC